MKKMKKLNLNKVRIVSLRSLQTIYGGSATDTITTVTDDTQSISTGDTEPDGGNPANGGGTLKSVPITNDCSFVLTECQLADV